MFAEALKDSLSGQDHISRIQTLRSLIKTVESPDAREHFSFSSMLSLGLKGVPRGALIEIAGAGKTEAVLQFLAENPSLRVAWIEEQLTVYPLAFIQRKVPLSRVLFIECKKEIFWAASQVLRSGLFEVVVLSFENFLNEKVMRRLQLETEKANAGVFLLPAFESGQAGQVDPRKSASQTISWPISMQLNVKNRTGNQAPFELNLARRRG